MTLGTTCQLSALGALFGIGWKFKLHVLHIGEGLDQFVGVDVQCVQVGTRTTATLLLLSISLARSLLKRYTPDTALLGLAAVYFCVCKRAWMR